MIRHKLRHGSSGTAWEPFRCLPMSIGEPKRQTARSLIHFKIGRDTMTPEMMRGLGVLKKAAAPDDAEGPVRGFRSLVRPVNPATAQFNCVSPCPVFGPTESVPTPRT